MNFLKKLAQSSLATLSIFFVVAFLCIFNIVPFEKDIILPFFIGGVLLSFGQAIFLTGIDLSILEVGKRTGTRLMRMKKFWLIILFGFVFGFVTTIAEPDAQVLVEQITSINSFLSTWFILSIFGIGAGLFVSFALFRVLKNISLKYALLVIYALIFILAIFAPSEFFGFAFDAGSVATGTITAPFLLSLVIGLCAVRSGTSKDDNFGAVAIVSTGPILAVLILGIIVGPVNNGGVAQETATEFLPILIQNIKDVSIALSPLLVIFIVLQIFVLKLPHKLGFKIFIGFLISYLGLICFLTGVFYGFSPMGYLVGENIANINIFLILLLGAVLGFLVVFTEPSILVLASEVEEVTSKMLKKWVIYITLGIGISISVVIGLLHVVYDINIWFILLPVIAVAVILGFVVPPIFTGIAFDSGGIASGTMTVSFILPICIGISRILNGGDSAINAFGLAGIVASIPIVAIEMLGLIYMTLNKKKGKRNVESNNGNNCE